MGGTYISPWTCARREGCFDCSCARASFVDRETATTHVLCSSRSDLTVSRPMPLEIGSKFSDFDGDKQNTPRCASDQYYGLYIGIHG